MTMFVVPEDKSTKIKPEFPTYIDTKVKKPIRKARINLPPGLMIPKIEVKFERPRFATPIHNPPCIEKILQKRKHDLEQKIENTAKVNGNTQNFY